MIVKAIIDKNDNIINLKIDTSDGNFSQVESRFVRENGSRPYYGKKIPDKTFKQFKKKLSETWKRPDLHKIIETGPDMPDALPDLPEKNHE